MLDYYRETLGGIGEKGTLALCLKTRMATRFLPDVNDQLPPNENERANNIGTIK